MITGRVVAAIVFLLTGGSLFPASAQLFGSSGLDPKFCEQPSFRQTAVYVDDLLMIDGKTDWATKLASKLRATMAPGERVTVVRLSPSSGSSTEVWAGCWPAFTAEQKASLASQTYLFSKNPLNSIDEQQKFFLSGLSGALGSIYVDAKRAPSAVKIDPASPPDKNILRSIASDEARFAHSQTTVRAIVYSDLAENSDLGSVFKTTAGGAEGIGDKLGTYLRRAVIYVYGSAEDVTNAPSVASRIRSFWTAAFRSMRASVGGIGPDLNLSNELPVAAYDFNLELQHSGQTLTGRLSLLVSADGTLVDSTIAVTRLSNAPLTGTFRCRAAQRECQLDAQTSGIVTAQATPETLVAKGDVEGGLKGQIGVTGSLSDPLTAIVAEK